MVTHTFIAETKGARLDVWLSGCLPDISRARLQALIREGHIRVNGHEVKAHHHVAVGERVEVFIPEAKPVDVAPEPIPLAVLYEDSDMIVVDKPAGLVVHPAAGHASGTLVNAVLFHCEDLEGIGGELRPGIVHRLDKDTSGVLVVAKTAAAMENLAAQFKGRNVSKEYIAMVWGTPRPPSGRIETLIGRSPHDRKKMSARVTAGRTAVTHYSTLETLGPISLLSVGIETGRTHQIRVHLAHLGYPVVGDATYGRRHPPALPVDVKRQMLHAARLKLHHPRTGVPLLFEAAMPADMQHLLDALRRGGNERH